MSRKSSNPNPNRLYSCRHCNHCCSFSCAKLIMRPCCDVWHVVKLYTNNLCGHHMTDERATAHNSDVYLYHHHAWSVRRDGSCTLSCRRSLSCSSSLFVIRYPSSFYILQPPRRSSKKNCQLTTGIVTPKGEWIFLPVDPIRVDIQFC